VLPPPQQQQQQQQQPVVAVAFISRHGLYHEHAPHEIPNRANIAALRALGVRNVVAFSAVGSLQAHVRPRDFVVPDQIIDRTKGVRPWTFFEGGVVGHIPFADPFDERLAAIVRRCGHSLEGDGVRLHDRGTLICMGKILFFLSEIKKGKEGEGVFFSGLKNFFIKNVPSGYPLNSLFV
jgi:purine nucleoside phosphorylase